MFAKIVLCLGITIAAPAATAQNIARIHPLVRMARCVWRGLLILNCHKIVLDILDSQAKHDDV